MNDSEKMIKGLRDAVKRANLYEGGVVHMTTEVVNMIIEALEDEKESRHEDG